MKQRPKFVSIIPAVIILVFLASAVALVLEIMVASVANRAADGSATTALGGICLACIPVLAGFWKWETGQSGPPGSQEPPEPDAIDPSALSEAQKIIKRHLDQLDLRGRLRGWRLTT